LVRFVYAAEPDALLEWEERLAEPAFPHIVISAFHISRSAVLQSSIHMMQRCTAWILRKDGGAIKPDAAILFDEDGGPLSACFFGQLGEINADVIRILAGHAVGASSSGFDEYVQVPSDIRPSIARRKPPTGVLFSDLASSVLQMLSYRRKRMNRDAAGR
jgi:hypothetical protein